MRFEQIPALPRASWRGHIDELVRDRLTYLRSMSERGDLVRGRVGVLPLVFANTPRSVHEVLVDKARSFEKSPGLRLVLHYLAGEGLFTSEGELWRRQRKLMAPLFQPSSLDRYARSMHRCAARLADGWQREQRVDLAHEMTRVTMSIVGATLFGVETLEETDELGEALTTSLQWTSDNIGSSWLMLHILMLDAARAAETRLPSSLRPAGERLGERLREPFLLHGAREAPLQNAIRRIDASIQEMIDERRRAPTAHDDLLSRLLHARDDESGQGMSDRQVRDEAVTLFVAGHETTATALAWAFYLLARHPEHLARAQAEADALGPDGLTAHAPSRLPFLTRVFKETLRLYPPVVVLARRSLVPVEICGYELPARTITMVSPYTVHHRQDLYPDPDRFDPDRWLPEHEASRPRSSFLPFGAGPRVCIGNHFALMEGPIVMATLLQRARIAVDPRREIVPDVFATLRPAGGVPAVVSPREHPSGVAA